jgi:hypothetical protein
MMEASDGPTLDKQGRRRRYLRYPTRGTQVSLTPGKVAALRHLAERRILSVAQLARLIPAHEKTTRRYMRDLFDASLVDVIPVSRLVLSGSETVSDLSLIHGSAPNLYVATREGKALLFEAGQIDRKCRDTPVPTYGPRNSFYLAHELAVQDVAIWLSETCRAHGGELGVWHMGGEAAIALQHGQLRPDAWFTLELGNLLPGKRLTMLVEVDRGTERGLVRWQEKVQGYRTLFSTPGMLQDRLGQKRARILVTVPDATRRERLASQIREIAGDPALASLFWLIVASELTPSAWQQPLWRCAGRDGLRPILDSPTKGPLS